MQLDLNARARRLYLPVGADTAFDTAIFQDLGQNSVLMSRLISCHNKGSEDSSPLFISMAILTLAALSEPRTSEGVSSHSSRTCTPNASDAVFFTYLATRIRESIWKLRRES